MKRTTTIVLLLMTVVSAFAQPRLHEPEIYVGLHGGALFSMTMFTPAVDGTKTLLDRTLLSGNGGFIFRYAGHKCCGLQLELDYMQRGWREHIGDDLSSSSYYNRRLDYLEIPFMSHIYFGKKMVRGFFNVGPKIGVCIMEHQSGPKHETKQEQYAPVDHILDWGLTGGLGLLLRTQKAGVFQVEARVGYSLGNYFDNHKSAYFSTSNPLDVSVNIGYLWEIKRHEN